MVGSGLFRRARGRLVVYHGKAGQKADDPVSVKPFDEQDEKMQEAIRSGKATVIDTSKPLEGTMGVAADDMIDAMEGGNMNALRARPQMTSRQASTGPSMHASAQDLGALQSPGTTSSG